MNHTRRHRQRGAVIITVCLMLLFLLGFMGIALDFGRLFIVKTELQTAMDSCALSAAQELDQPADLDHPGRAVAGETAGNLNRVNMQSANWGGQGQLAAAEHHFRNAAYQRHDRSPPCPVRRSASTPSPACRCGCCRPWAPSPATPRPSPTRDT